MDCDSMAVWDEDLDGSIRIMSDERKGCKIKRKLIGFGFWKRRAENSQQKISSVLTQILGREYADEMIRNYDRTAIALSNNTVLRMEPMNPESRPGSHRLYEVYVDERGKYY